MADPTKHPDKETNDFYEAMPATWDQSLYREEAAKAEPAGSTQADDTRRTAIITLALVAITTIILGVLFIRMLGSVENGTPLPDSNPATSSLYK